MNHPQLTWAPLCLILLISCAAEDDGDSYSDGYGDDYYSSADDTSKECDYEELITPTERQEANQCGTQVSMQFAAADNYYEAAVVACQTSSQADGDTNYNSYLTTTELARKAKDRLCGGTSGGGLTDTTEAKYYSLCTYLDGLQVWATCYGPKTLTDQSCPADKPWNFLEQHSSSSACINARDNYLENY
ncbi:hypothetical protein [Gilvimarinus xylanilyticus]|uniref:Uncharacterized protein n=1 Tax=Gilvimarinus xylanilyticus TaxID=2944139 RepID=A0A9X2KUM3_9GAMM|nr:hypothetical protein [Gilvimarinus xylanilyticus]MCP8900449.1 hypothetical protein [Gilvimarinus xylanilyticus]